MRRDRDLSVHEATQVGVVVLFDGHQKHERLQRLVHETEFPRAESEHADGGEPGRVDRLGPQLPMKRGGDAIEVARAILWLLSSEASYSTGTFIEVSGGR